VSTKCYFPLRNAVEAVTNCMSCTVCMFQRGGSTAGTALSTLELLVPICTGRSTTSIQQGIQGQDAWYHGYG
jgi:hypothetical protein